MLFVFALLVQQVSFVCCVFEKLVLLALDELRGPWFSSSHTAVGMMIWKGRVLVCFVVKIRINRRKLEIRKRILNITVVS